MKAYYEVGKGEVLCDDVSLLVELDDVDDFRNVSGLSADDQKGGFDVGDFFGDCFEVDFDCDFSD